MKYFIDTEFIEGFRKSIFGKSRHFIDLISIGIVAEDGREYYAISNEFNYKDADKWVKENVIYTLPLRLMKKEAVSDFKKRCYLTDIYEGPWYDGKSNEQIAIEIQSFVSGSTIKNDGISIKYNFYHTQGDVQFYGYYCDYDWVVFCSLFGRMIDLPKGFPMYCRDLKQQFDVKQETSTLDLKKHPKYPTQEKEHDALEDARWNKKLYEFLQTI